MCHISGNLVNCSTIEYASTAESHHLAVIKSVQGAPIKNNPLEKMLYFSHDCTDFSQTFRRCM